MENKIRRAARMVIFDKTNDKIAVLEVKGGSYHKIPGGGIEPGESAEDAAIREAREEGACEVKIIRKIGVSELQYTGDEGKLDQSHCFLALKTTDRLGNSFTDEEMKDNFKLLWVNFEEAIEKFKNPKTNVGFELAINQRDLGFVEQAEKLLNIIMQTLVGKAREKLFKMISDFGSDPWRLAVHVPEMEKWAQFLLDKHPEADREVVLLAVWLHDAGHYPLPTDIDHAVRGEDRAKEFLEKEDYPADKTSMVRHCVRAHRCRDVMPETLEARIIACADSASHMTEPMYFDIARQNRVKRDDYSVYEKMARDFRDLAYFPEVQEELKGLYDAWEKLLREYEKINY